MCCSNPGLPAVLQAFLPHRGFAQISFGFLLPTSVVLSLPTSDVRSRPTFVMLFRLTYVVRSRPASAVHSRPTSAVRSRPTSVVISVVYLNDDFMSDLKLSHELYVFLDPFSPDSCKSTFIVWRYF